MSVGLGLLKKIIVEKRALSYIEDVLDISQDCLIDEPEKKVYAYIRTHFLTYGELPQLKTVERECGVSFAKLTDEPIGYWADKVRNRHIDMVALATSKALKDAVASGDSQKAVETARRMIADLTRVSAEDKPATLGEVAKEVVADHDRRQRSSKLSGIPFGIPFLDEVTDGAQPADTVAFVGQTSVGKSMLLTFMAYNAYKENHIPLFVPLEMSLKQTTRRVLAMEAHLSPRTIKHGKLSYWGREKLLGRIKRVDENPVPFHLIGGSMTSSIENIGIRIQELRPDIVYIDGGYLLRTKNKFKESARWERIAYTSEVIKAMAVDFNIPFIVTYQYNSRGPGLGNIGGSGAAISQLASIVCSIEDEDPKQASNWSAETYKILKLYKGRDGEKGEIKMLYDLDRGLIAQDSVISGLSLEDSQ